jgi:hypothetical protein
VNDGKQSPKDGAQRIKELRQRRRALGLKEVRNLWTHPDDEQAIRDYAERLARKRGISF